MSSTAPELAQPSGPLLAVRDLAVSFLSGSGRDAPRTRAVDGVSLTIYPRQTLAVVGESGCGKSVTAMSLLHLLPRPPAVVERGTAEFQTGAGPRDLLAMSEREIRAISGGEIAMIFQEPMTSLNPVFSIGDQIIEAITLHQRLRSREAMSIAIESLRAVGISEPEKRLGAYPHQFSGGMRQRVMIAMALACKPRLLLADEPTTALDVTIQKQILELLRDLRRQSDLAVMLITHDLGLVADYADVVCVMYAGRVVEYAAVGDLFAQPLHPYTRGLLACVPRIAERRERLSTIAEVIDRAGAFDAPPGCPDGARPWWPGQRTPANVTDHSASSDSVLFEATPGHWISLWRSKELSAPSARPPNIAPIATDSRLPVFNIPSGAR